MEKRIDRKQTSLKQTSLKQTSLKKEKWIIWHPSPLITKDHILIGLSNVLDEGIILYFKNFDTKEIIKLTFDCRVEFYRFTDEGTKLDMFAYISSNYEDGFLRNNDMFEVLHSNLINKIYSDVNGAVAWLSKELRHFVAMNDNGVFEIIADGEPHVEIVDKE